MGNDDLADGLKYGIAVGVVLASVVYWVLGRLRSDDSSQSVEEMDTEELLARIDLDLEMVRECAEELAGRAGSQPASTSPTTEEELMDELADFDVDMGPVQDALDFDLETEEISLDDEESEGEASTDTGEDSPD